MQFSNRQFFRVSEPFTLLALPVHETILPQAHVEKFQSILSKVVKGAVSGNKSTPQNNPKKKRPLSSPADQTDLKKTKPITEGAGEGDGSNFPIAEEPEAGSAPTQITLSKDNLTQISSLLRSCFENQLPALVSDIVDGVGSSLNQRIDSLSDENAKLRRRVEELELKVDRAEQYSRRNCLRMSGISETDNESVDEKVIQLTIAIGSEITLSDIDRCHRLARPRAASSQTRRPDHVI